MGIVQDSHIAADITQDVFIKVYVSINSYKHQGFKTWISRIATNQSIDYIRKKSREHSKTISLDQYKEIISNKETPEDIFLQEEKRKKLISICHNLDPKYSVVLNKYYFENKSYSMIASEENISIKTVESRLYRAKKMIIQRWEED